MEIVTCGVIAVVTSSALVALVVALGDDALGDDALGDEVMTMTAVDLSVAEVVLIWNTIVAGVGLGSDLRVNACCVT